jgi:hypothetical protein
MITLAPCLMLALAGTVAAGEPQRTAVVVGIETYQHLGDELRVEGARDDAMRVAEALETRAGFGHVQLLTDAAATRSAIESVLAGGMGLGEDDLFLLYFVGHGIGGDFGEPRLFTYDSDPEDLEPSTWPVQELARTITQGIQAGAIVLVTDSSHAGSLQDLALLGPSPDQWPDLGRPSMVISASGPREPAQPNALAAAFAGAVTGRADTSADGSVTSGELYRHLVRMVPSATGDAQHPTVNAAHDPTFVVAALGAGDARAAGPQDRIDKVKFIFHSGVSPTVHCGQGAVVACDPSCYVWDIEPGQCTASAVLDDRRQSVEVQVLQRGGWVCEDGAGGLACTPGP